MSSRQKSCNGCVRAKRKCDKGLPRCRRCVARQIDCEYTERGYARAVESAAYDNGSELALAGVITEDSPLGVLHCQSESQCLTLAPVMLDPSFRVGLNDFCLPGLPGGNEFDASAVFNDLELARHPTHPSAVSEINWLPRVEFVAKRLAEVPRCFAGRAQTMFIHRRQLQIPHSQLLQDAMSMCALYCMKTSDNRTVVCSALQHKVKQLVASVDLLRVPKAELLIAVQALLIYQIIRLFDGDIRLRAEAEADEVTFLTWMTELRSRMQIIEPSSSSLTESWHPKELNAAIWTRWLLEESVRRTVFTAIMVKAMYDFLKYGFDNVEENGLCFTAQSALWNAQTEYSWRMAYQHRERLEVRALNWSHDVAKATPDDLEELGVLTMASIWGLESTVEWLGQEHVSRYGLDRY